MNKYVLMAALTLCGVGVAVAQTPVGVFATPLACEASTEVYKPSVLSGHRPATSEEFRERIAERQCGEMVIAGGEWAIVALPAWFELLWTGTRESATSTAAWVCGNPARGFRLIPQSETADARWMRIEEEKLAARRRIESSRRDAEDAKMHRRVQPEWNRPAPMPPPQSPRTIFVFIPPPRDVNWEGPATVVGLLAIAAAILLDKDDGANITNSNTNNNTNTNNGGGVEEEEDVDEEEDERVPPGGVTGPAFKKNQLAREIFGLPATPKFGITPQGVRLGFSIPLGR